MTDRPSRSDTGDRESRGGWRWTKVVLIVIALVVLVTVVLLLTGGLPGGHGPSRHG